jgi:hypothetical protein
MLVKGPNDKIDYDCYRLIEKFCDGSRLPKSLKPFNLKPLLNQVFIFYDIGEFECLMMLTELIRFNNYRLL